MKNRLTIGLFQAKVLFDYRTPLVILAHVSTDYAVSPIGGAAGGDRTHDPWLRRPILYPLSYSRNSKKDRYSHFRMQPG